MEEKLPMCRICLVKNVHMDVVVDKNLHELYEKLTDIPFVTEDSRPILACFVCCAQLKKCYRLLTKCQKAEERFAQIMNGNYEPKPLINEDYLELFHGFINSPIQSISIVEDGQIESIAVKEELQDVCEGLDDIMEPNEEYSNDEDDLELENLDNSRLHEEDILAHGSEFDSGDDVPLMEIKIEEEEQQEAPKEKCRAVDTKNLKLENLDNSRLDEEDILAHGSEFDSEDNVPLMEIKIEEEEQQEAPKEKRRAVDTKSAPPAAKKPKLDVKKEKNETSVPPKHTKKGQEQIKNTENTKKRTSKTIIKTTKNVKKKNSIKTSQHTGEKPYKCDICQSKFSMKGNLKSHIHRHTGEKPYKCDICQSSFSQKGNLYKHIRTHAGEKPYTCDICQSTFSLKSNLQKHIRTHTGEKPFTCDICQSSFSQSCNLKTHYRTHTGEKPFKCYICQSSFSETGTLKRHIRTHTGEKPYKCDICQSSFSEKGNLKRHIRRHTGEKPFKCVICQSSFSEKGNLKTHFRTHTGEKPHKCGHL